MTTAADYISFSSGVIYVQATAPDNPTNGDLWFDQAAKVWKYLDAGVWVALAGGGGVALPPATREGQVLVAGVPPGFVWGAGDTDCGRY